MSSPTPNSARRGYRVHSTCSCATIIARVLYMEPTRSKREGRGDPSKGIEAVIARLEAGTFQAPSTAPDPTTKQGGK